MMRRGISVMISLMTMIVMMFSWKRRCPQPNQIKKSSRVHEFVVLEVDISRKEWHIWRFYFLLYKTKWTKNIYSSFFRTLISLCCWRWWHYSYRHPRLLWDYFRWYFLVIHRVFLADKDPKTLNKVICCFQRTPRKAQRMNLRILKSALLLKHST